MTTTDARTPVHQRFRELRERAGLSMDALARAMGFRGASSIQRYMNPDYKKTYLTVEIAERAADALAGKGEPPITRDEVLDLCGPALRTPTAGTAALSSDVDISTIQTEGLVGDRDFPIYASAQGGQTGMVVTFEPVEWVRRPSPLIGVKGGFGVYVVGDSMEPVFRQGDMLLIHPHRPPVNGDDVLVVLTDGNGSTEAMVKRLVHRHDKGVCVQQFNPPAEFSIPSRFLDRVLKSVGSYRGR
ncbi:helix-turn-helix transcriptional regulator [Roseospira marina]